MLRSSIRDGLWRAAWAAASVLVFSSGACIEVPISTAPEPAASDAAVGDDGNAALPRRPPDGRPGDARAYDTPAAENAPDASAEGADAGAMRTGGGPTAQPAIGDLVITELMPDPGAVSDEQGEWIELFNRRESGAIELAGCALNDGNTREHPIRTSLSVPAGAYVTLARSEQPGFTPDLVLDFSLANSADSVGLWCGGVEIDRVVYDAQFPVQAGASLSLDPERKDAAANDSAGAWCASSAALGEDFGTPGAGNPRCGAGSPAASGDAKASSAKSDISKSSTAKSSPAKSTASKSSSSKASSSKASSAKTSSAKPKPAASKPAPSKPAPSKPAPNKPPPAVSADPAAQDAALHPRAGEVVITEFMSDPTAVADAGGEWIELYNAGTRDIELRGCALDDNGARHPISESLRLQAGAYAALAGDGAGFAPDIVLTFSLSNGADRIALICDETEVDRVDYGAGFPLEPGTSTSLDPGSLDAAANDAPQAWCSSRVVLGAQFGTPGAPNEPCSAESAEPPAAQPTPDAGSGEAPEALPLADAGVPEGAEPAADPPPTDASVEPTPDASAAPDAAAEPSPEPPAETGPALPEEAEPDPSEPEPAPPDEEPPPPEAAPAEPAPGDAGAAT